MLILVIDGEVRILEDFDTHASRWRDPLRHHIFGGYLGKIVNLSQEVLPTMCLLLGGEGLRLSVFQKHKMFTFGKGDVVYLGKFYRIFGLLIFILQKTSTRIGNEFLLSNINKFLVQFIINVVVV